ncbi:MAG: branched-chain amino acid ABC transporter permease [Deltaproteobacteria bacterium]|nr:branched-chain amino acid ABC transporter permease [Deltaproteobacteria bacterium]MBW1935607.1 branched-chain amino acid ABC transporter permease [Deltaproteobacteria bacterium]MBW1978000.1 branched-chain amino acid ABC transporter permease [Deltaproteobacteria bacterium]MBW2045899.1 branched-chain amino acid ABC transporter permease [Deltaproteobacteria bacterium]MBW2301539.1 branched-chain amino acid ABC transporter permease [Deltaproteobacteria bacterium]
MVKYKWPILGVLFVGFATVPVWGSEYVLLFCLLYCLYLAMSQMWNLLAGYTSLLSLGQQAFIGFSGYAVAVLTNYYGVYIWLSVLIGGFFSVLLALFMSLFIFRMRGIYFAIGTWIFAEMLLLWFSNWKYVKYGTGLFIKPPHPPSMTTIYYASLIMGAGATAAIYIILRSKIGLGLMAMRDDEDVSEAMGVEIFRSKLFCFMVGSFITGLTAGVLYVFQIFIQPYKAFAIDWTVILVFIVIIGGIGTIEGPIVGTFIYVLLSQWLAEYAHISLLLLGIIAITIILLAPTGIMGTLHQKTGFAILSPRRL